MKNLLLNLIGFPTVASATASFNKAITNLDKAGRRHAKVVELRTARIAEMTAANRESNSEGARAHMLADKLRRLVA